MTWQNNHGAPLSSKSMTGRQPSGKVAPDCSPLLIRPHHHCKTHHQPNQVSNCPFASVSAWQTGVQLKVIYVEIVTMLKLLQRCAKMCNVGDADWHHIPKRVDWDSWCCLDIDAAVCEPICKNVARLCQTGVPSISKQKMSERHSQWHHHMMLPADNI